MTKKPKLRWFIHEVFAFDDGKIVGKIVRTEQFGWFAYDLRGTSPKEVSAGERTAFAARQAVEAAIREEGKCQKPKRSR